MTRPKEIIAPLVSKNFFSCNFFILHSGERIGKKINLPWSRQLFHHAHASWPCNRNISKPNFLGGAHRLDRRKRDLYASQNTYAVSMVVGVKGRSDRMVVSSPVFVLNYRKWVSAWYSIYRFFPFHPFKLQTLTIFNALGCGWSTLCVLGQWMRFLNCLLSQHMVDVNNHSMNGAIWIYLPVLNRGIHWICLVFAWYKGSIIVSNTYICMVSPAFLVVLHEIWFATKYIHGGCCCWWSLWSLWLCVCQRIVVVGECWVRKHD